MRLKPKVQVRTAERGAKLKLSGAAAANYFVDTIVVLLFQRVKIIGLRAKVWKHAMGGGARSLTENFGHAEEQRPWFFNSCYSEGRLQKLLQILIFVSS